MPERWRVALIDSGADAVARIETSARFVETAAGFSTLPLAADASGHGTRVASIIASAQPPPGLVVAQVFEQRRGTTAAAVAAAIHWALAARADLIHMSLGLREDREVLAAAVAAATAQGRLVVASTPARGAEVYPAAYPGVIRASGDARCGPDELCALDAAEARFGACPQTPGRRDAGGASIAAAHLTRLIVTHLRPGTPFAAARDRLASLARFHGRERRSAFDPIGRRVDQRP